MITFQALVVFPILIWVSFGIGLFISRVLRFRYSSTLEFTSYSIGLGLIVFASIGFIFGVFGILNKVAVLTGFLFVAILGFPSKKTHEYFFHSVHRDKTEDKWKILRRITLAYLSLLIVVALIGALSPDIVWDAHSYHLDLPKSWIESGRMGYLPYNFASLWPLNLSVLYAQQLLFFEGSTLPQLTHFLMGILSTALIYSFAKRNFGEPSALIASAAFYSIPAVSWLSTTAISDLGMAYFSIFGLTSLLTWMEKKDYRWLLLSGVGFGAGMGTKNLGIISLIAAISMLVFVSARKSSDRKRLIQSVFLISLVAAVFVAPWLIRSYAYSGNPVYPFAFSIFGGKYWTSSINERFLAQQYSSWGIQRTFIEYVLLPFRLLRTEHFPYGGWISFLFLTAVIFELIRRKSNKSSQLLIFSALFFVLWARFSSQQIRMLLPALGMLSVLIGSMAWDISNWLAEYLLSRKRPQINPGSESVKSRIHSNILVLMLFVIMLEGIFGVRKERAILFKDQALVVAGELSREEFMAQRFYPSGAFSYLNEELPQNGAVLAFNEVRGFTVSREFIWGSPNLQGYIDYEALTTKSLFEKRFDDLGIKYVLINNSGYPTQAEELDSIKDSLKLIYDHGEILIYEFEK